MFTYCNWEAFRSFLRIPLQKQTLAHGCCCSAWRIFYKQDLNGLNSPHMKILCLKISDCFMYKHMQDACYKLNDCTNKQQDKGVRVNTDREYDESPKNRPKYHIFLSLVQR